MIPLLVVLWSFTFSRIFEDDDDDDDKDTLRRLEFGCKESVLIVCGVKVNIWGSQCYNYRRISKVISNVIYI